MKKKIIFVICTIVILCVGSLVSAATTLTDIKNTKYEDSVNTLITLGLVNGYPEDNTYRPDNTVTRAEMAKLMVVALGEEGRVENAAKNQTKFKDMNGHWAYGYVNLAAELGVINGYPNGTFGPNDTVSYAEATAMVLRALEYEEEVSKSTEVWPNNYINQAKKLSLYNSVGTINSNDAAKRGNIAIMLWNMLRTGICTPIGQNANGLIYGEGEKMINKKLTGFVYLEDAMVSDIDFDDDFKEADVKIKGDKTITIEMEAREAAKMYGQKVDILYNTTKEEIELLEMTDEATIREGEIEKIKSSKIYIDGGSSSGYSLPDDDNILLYGIEDLDEAVSAILVFDGSKLEYVIAFPPEDIYLALVTDNDVTVSKEDGIKVVNYKTSSAKSYALADDEDVPEIDDIILYYLNSDNELVILDSANVFDSKEIEKVTTSSSKLEFGDTTYKYSSNTDTIAKLSSNTLKAMSLSSIEEDEDSAVLLKFANERYFVIFVGGVGQAEEDLEEDIEKAIKTLSTYMTKNTTKNAITNEVKYTQSTFATFMNAYEDAETAIADAEKKASTTNLNKVNLAYEDLQEAYKGLKLITSLSSSSRDTEKEKVELKVALRRIVNGTTSVDGKKVTTCVTNKANYTTASYNTFNTALTAAKTQLAKTNATKSNLEKVKGNLEAAIKGLVLKTEDTARVNALEDLNEAIDAAKDIGKTNNGKYTEDSFAIFLDYYEAAEKMKTSTDATAINEAAENLNRAIRALFGTKEEALAELNDKIDEAVAYENNSGDYFDEEFEAFVGALEAARNEKLSDKATESSLKAKCDALGDAITNLKAAKIDDVLAGLKKVAKEKYTLEDILKLAKDDEVDRTDKLEKIEALKIAMKREDDDIEIARIKLESAIKIASRIKTKEEWYEQYGGSEKSFNDMQAKLEVANTINGTKTASSVALNEACEALEATLVSKPVSNK